MCLCLGRQLSLDEMPCAYPSKDSVAPVPSPDSSDPLLLVASLECSCPSDIAIAGQVVQVMNDECVDGNKWEKS